MSFSAALHIIYKSFINIKEFILIINLPNGIMHTYYYTGFTQQSFGSVGDAGIAFVRRKQKTPQCPTEPVSANLRWTHCWQKRSLLIKLVAPL